MLKHKLKWKVFGVDITGGDVWVKLSGNLDRGKDNKLLRGIPLA
jgi:hypothetical protein